MATSNTTVVPVQLETVRQKFPKFYTDADTVVNAVVKPAKAGRHQISTWNTGSLSAFRIPVQQYEGGVFKAVDLNNGDLGDGNMQTFQYMTIGYFALALNWMLPTLSMYATQNNQQAIVNVWKDALKAAVPAMTNYSDILFHTAGDGILATGSGSGAAPSGTNPTYNLESNFGPQRLQLGQTVDVYNAAGSSSKGTNLIVTGVNFPSKTVTLSGTVTAPANDDVIAVAGLSATLAAGSCRLGLYNFNSSTASGSTLGLSRTTVTELVTPSVDASSASLTPAFALQLKDLLIQRRSPDSYKGAVGIAHMAQRAAAFFTGDAIAEWQIRGNSVGESLDRVPTNSNEDSDFTFGTVKHMVSKRQNRSRIDWVVPDQWGRVNLQEMDFFKRGSDGSYVFENRSSSGTVKTAMFFSLIATDNIYCADPGSGGIIQSLAIPSGY